MSILKRWWIQHLIRRYKLNYGVWTDLNHEYQQAGKPDLAYIARDKMEEYRDKLAYLTAKLS